MSSKSVTILGVKIPLENIRATVTIPGGWVSYKFLYYVTLPPPKNAWVAVAPSAPSNVSPPSRVKGFDSAYCSCRARSFWEGDCDFCRARPAPRPLIEDYNEYCNFSTFAVGNSFGNDIMEAAREEGAEYARRLNALVRSEYV